MSPATLRCCKRNAPPRIRLGWGSLMGSLTALILSLILSVGTAWGEITVRPEQIVLSGPESSQQVLVTQTRGEQRSDVTRTATYAVIGPPLVRIDSQGLVQPLAEGTTVLAVSVGDAKVSVPVTVAGLANPPAVSFEHDVLPVLTKSRCNSGGCHGKAEGQNGFKLSLFGFDADADYAAILKEGRGRRVALAAPTQSLLLRKGTAELPHGGGQKIELASPQYERLRRWIASGAPREVPGDRPVVGIEVEPAQLIMAPEQTQQLRVTAIDSGGGRRCATVETEFISNAEHIVEASPRGLLTSSDVPGEAAILVRYLGHVAVCRVAVPRSGQQIARPPEHNFVDKHVWDKLQRLGIAPSELADDATFLRRAYLDTLGTLPTAAEARAFLTDTAADKRARLVDALLERPEYADYWTMKWSDILRADKTKISHQGTVGLTRWLHRQFRENRPFDAMARDLLTAQGPVQSESPAAFFKAVNEPAVASRAVSQLFLGVRIECAQCHHHPSERWSQDDYAALAGFFTGVKIKRLPDGTEAVVSRGGTDVPHPRTGTPVAARPLGATASELAAAGDRREVFAQWMTQPDNPYFARTLSNRLWAHYFGRGLVEPIDDLRATNPPTNEPLLDALAAHLREVKYDLKAFTRTLLNSRAYQLSGEANESNRDDRQYFSHAWPKAMPAEVLLDALCQATGVPEKFNGWPLGTRSIAVWDNRMPSYFFRIFGRPVRATVCECERSNDPSISQALHLLNSPEINEKITARSGMAQRLADSEATPEAIITEIYLGTVSRFPRGEELSLLKQAFQASDLTRHQATEDVLWSVLNSKEFLYNQ
jgi:hypothetical protein